VKDETVYLKTPLLSMVIPSYKLAYLLIIYAVRGIIWQMSDKTSKPEAEPKNGLFTDPAGVPDAKDPKQAGDEKTADSYSQHSSFWAERMRSGGSFSHTHIEKPVMYEKMARLAPGSTVLCIGCGSGEECAEVAEMGTAKVVGTDISAGLIDEAKKGFPDIEFHVAAAEDHAKFAAESFDVIYSSLTMHYVKNWQPVFTDYLRLLKPGGTFLFSTNHPIRWGMDMVRNQGSRVTTMLLGYTAEPDTLQVRIYGDYLNHFTKHDRFMKKIQVTYYNRPFSKMWHDIKNAGFDIIDIVEPKSVEKDVPERFSGFSKITQKIPYFIIFELKKPLTSPTHEPVNPTNSPAQ